jgi:hypothetical protein
MQWRRYLYLIHCNKRRGVYVCGGGWGGWVGGGGGGVCVCVWGGGGGGI